MNPFQDPPPSEVHLESAPLDRVICQVRFPPIMSIGLEEFVAGFQEAIRPDYPLMSQFGLARFQMIFQAAPGGAEMVPPGASQLPPPMRGYRFDTADHLWRLFLTPEFLALETSKYDDRDGFMTRLGKAFHALGAHIGPAHTTRLGVRYIDRIGGEPLKRISDFFSPELLGLFHDPVQRQNVIQLLSEAQFVIPEGRMVARWGLLPENASTDPSTIEPRPEPTWIMDLDASHEELVAFDADKLVLEARKLSERSYTFFRWAVKEEFLTYFKESRP